MILDNNGEPVNGEPVKEKPHQFGVFNIPDDVHLSLKQGLPTDPRDFPLTPDGSAYQEYTKIRMTLK